MTLLDVDRITDLKTVIARAIGDTRYKTWFGPGTNFVLESDHLVIQVKNQFVATWIANNHLPAIQTAVQTVFGTVPHLPVRIVAPEVSAPPSAAATGAAPAIPAPRPAPKPDSPPAHHIHLRGELCDFVVGAGNQVAFSAAQAMAQHPGRSFGLLLIHGGCGLGKTHLVQGICNELRKTRPGFSWRYVSGEEFTNEYIAAVKAGRTDAFRARYRNVDLLAIDDIHFLANKRATQDEFLHTYNAINASGKAVVLTSDRHPRSLATFSEPLVNRLISGMVVEVAPPDLETRREILRRRRAQMGCEISDMVLDYLARHITQNVRELEGALNKLNMFAAALRQPVTIEWVKSLLEDLLRRSSTGPTLEQIERHVARHFGLLPEHIRSRSRDRTVALARGLTVFLIRKHCPMSYPEIGRALGNKNHSTMVMAWQRIDALLHNDAEVRWKNAGQDQKALIRALLETLEQMVLTPV